MAAAIASRRAVHNKPKLENQNHEPLSFHLQLLVGKDFVLPDGKNSVGLLRLPFQKYDQNAGSDRIENPAKPVEKIKSKILLFKNRAMFESNQSNITGSKFEMWAKKFNNKALQNAESNENTWQERLIIVTEKRLFIITKKLHARKRRSSGVSETQDLESITDKFQDKGLEIVDSIPMEEIISVQVGSEGHKWIEDSTLERSTSFVSSHFNKLFHHNATDGDTEENVTSNAKKNKTCRNIESKLQSMPMTASEKEQYYEGVLRIRTKAAGFNRGCPYYFILKKEAMPLNGAVRKDSAAAERKERFLPTATLKRTRRDSGTSQEHDPGTRAGEMAKILTKLADRRRVEFNRETRFIRLQAFLQNIWNSLPFNLAVLLLIVSNFIFTVQQLENNDPGRQRFFETVDMAYTVLFSIGDPSPPSIGDLSPPIS